MKPVPEDVQTLARDLGISAKALRKLQQEHGDKLLKELQKRWRRNCREPAPRFLAGAPVAETEGKRQRLSAAQELGYSNATFNAIDSLEALPKQEQEAQSKEARERWEAYEATHRPSEFLARDLKRKSDRIRKLKADAIKAGIDVRSEFDSFIQTLEAKVSVATAKEAA